MTKALQNISGKCTGEKWCCQGLCGQGEGDCDEDSNCLDGLVCDYDGWFGTDFCRAGNSVLFFGKIILIFNFKIHSKCLNNYLETHH